MNLSIARNHRYFSLNGKPFFWLGDTAWLLFSKLTRKETLLYLDNRAQKGFTVVLATLIHFDNYANTDGSPAFVEDDFSRPNPDRSPDAYWPRVREAVDAARERGLFMALLPSWGKFVLKDQLNESNIDSYTSFLANWFGDCDNVIWLVGGDVRGNVAPERFEQIGSALRRKCPHQLIGYHPFGRCSSSMWFHESSWLDFNMFQSGHRNYNQIKLNAWDDRVDVERWVGEDNYKYVLNDRALVPAKPTLDGEPSYELIPQGLHDTTQPYWQAHDVRRYAYWSLLAGAAGHTYGDNAIMQFWTGKESPSYGALETWDVAIHDAGSLQMGHARRLMEAMLWQQGEPAQHLLAGEPGIQYHYNASFMTPVAACIYSHTGTPFEVSTSVLPFDAKCGWFDPVSGVLSLIGRVEASASVKFSPPNRRCGQNDWLLVLYDEGREDEFLAALKPLSASSPL